MEGPATTRKSFVAAVVLLGISLLFAYWLVYARAQSAMVRLIQVEEWDLVFELPGYYREMGESDSDIITFDHAHHVGDVRLVVSRLTGPEANDPLIACAQVWREVMSKLRINRSIHPPVIDELQVQSQPAAGILDVKRGVIIRCIQVTPSSSYVFLLIAHKSSIDQALFEEFERIWDSLKLPTG